jgi:AAA domain
LSGGTVVSFKDLPKRPPRGSPEHKALMMRERDERMAAAVVKVVAAQADVFAERDAAHRQAKVKALGGYRKLSALLTERRNVEWLIRDFLEAGVIALFAGPKGSYKSALANDIAMRVACTGAPVFILSPEGSGLQRRLQGWLDEFQPFVNAETLPLYVRDRRLNLSAAEEMATLVTWLDEIEKETGKPIALCVIDTWSKATAHDEDNNTQTKLLLGEIDRHLRHRGPKSATVLLVAHTGHSNQERARGASALAADTDAEYIVSFKNETVAVTRGRFKDSPALPPLYFKPKARTLNYADGEGIKATSVVLVPVSAPAKRAQNLTDTQQELLDHVTARLAVDGKALSLDRIRDGLEEKLDTIKRRLKTLTDRGALMCENGLYSIPPSIVNDPEGF